MLLNCCCRTRTLAGGGARGGPGGRPPSCSLPLHSASNLPSAPRRVLPPSPVPLQLPDSPVFAFPRVHLSPGPLPDLLAHRPRSEAAGLEAALQTVSKAALLTVSTALLTVSTPRPCRLPARHPCLHRYCFTASRSNRGLVRRRAQAKHRRDGPALDGAARLPHAQASGPVCSPSARTEALVWRRRGAG